MENEVNVNKAEVLSEHRKELQKASFWKIVLKVILVLVSIPVSLVVYYVVAAACFAIISFVGSIPYIGWIMYYPSDASWAQIAIPLPTGIFAACFCAKAISGTTKVVASLFALVFLIDIFFVIFTAFSFSLLAKAAMAFAAALICFAG